MFMCVRFGVGVGGGVVVVVVVENEVVLTEAVAASLT